MEFGIKQVLTVVTLLLTDSYISYIVFIYIRTVRICVVATCLAVALASVAPGLLCTSLLGALACAYM